MILEILLLEYLNNVCSPDKKYKLPLILPTIVGVKT